MNRYLYFGPALLLVLAACSSVEPDPLGPGSLEEARRLVEAGQLEDAWDILGDYDREDFDRLTRGDFSLLAGDVAYRTERWDDAVDFYEDYLLFEGAAANTRIAEERLFEIAVNMLEGDRLALGIFTQKDRGAGILFGLATYAPYGEYAAQSLARVGEYRFSEKEYLEAVDVYRLLLQIAPDSEWADLATFRIGLAGYERIERPNTDGSSIERALNQLNRYLALYPSGLYREEAEEIVADLEENLAAHDLALGDFYEDIDNVRGARHHYEIAAKLDETEAGREAQRRLDGLPPDPPLEGFVDEDEEG